MSVCRVVGIKKQRYEEGKNAGRVGCTYFLAGDFSEYDKNNKNSEVQGERVFVEFAYKDFGVVAGDNCEVVYEKGYQDKAQLANLYPVKVDKK